MTAKYVHRTGEQHYLEAEKQLVIADIHDAAALDHDEKGNYALANTSENQRDYALARAAVHAQLAAVGKVPGIGDINFSEHGERPEDWRGVTDA